MVFSFQGDTCSSYDPREYYNYELKQSNRVVYRGQTNNPNRREKEHKRDGKKFTHMNIVGNAKTNHGVREAEKKSLQRYRKNHNGKNPKYNKTDHG